MNFFLKWSEETYKFPSELAPFNVIHTDCLIWWDVCCIAVLSLRLPFSFFLQRSHNKSWWKSFLSRFLRTCVNFTALKHQMEFSPESNQTYSHRQDYDSDLPVTSESFWRILDGDGNYEWNMETSPSFTLTNSLELPTLLRRQISRAGRSERKKKLTT